MEQQRPSIEPVIVGAVGAPYGVRGWVHATSYTEPHDNLLGYRPWLIERDGAGGWVEVQVEAQRHNGDIVARFENVTDRAAAAALRGTKIGVAEEVLPPTEQDEHYWRDLIGLAVVTREGVPLGTVARLLPTPGNDVLVVEEATGADDSPRQRLIPFVRQIAVDVDAEAGRIVVHWQPDWP